MIKQQAIAIAALITAVLTPVSQTMVEFLSPLPEIKQEVLSEHDLNLETRAKGEYVNEVFKFNILHAVEKFGYSFTLEPNETFAFHENVLPEFVGQNLKTGWTRYTTEEGYKTVLGLPGNGVCHLASLMNWAASEAGLEVTAPVKHDFVPIPEVPREYGASIRYQLNWGNSQNQNLYIKNNLNFPVVFSFQTEQNRVNLKVLKETEQ